MIGLYLGDNYKISSRLTLNPGIRWDINPAMSEENYQLNSFDVPSHSIVLPQPLDYYYKLGITSPQVVQVFENVDMKFKSAAELGRSQNVFPPNYFDIAPRLGFAYQALSGTKAFVIRGGYGIYISAIPMRTLLAQFSGMAPFRATFSYNPNSAATSPDGIQNYLLRTIPAYIAGQNTGDVINVNSPNPVGRGQGVVGIDPHFPDLKIHEWNLAIEKQLSHTLVFRIRYTGKHGVNADQLKEINPAPTNYNYYVDTLQPTVTGPFSSVYNRPYDQTAYGSVRLLSKTGYINTETFTLEFERRFSKGLGFQAFYTLRTRCGWLETRSATASGPYQRSSSRAPCQPIPQR